MISYAKEPSMRNIIFYFASLLLTIFIVLNLFGDIGVRPKDLGVKDGKLKPCPSTPNCISTQSNPDDQQHYMPPLTYNSTKEEVMNKLVNIINSLERTKIIEKTDNYLYVEFRSKIMKYVDDVEFYIDDQTESLCTGSTEVQEWTESP